MTLLSPTDIRLPSRSEHLARQARLWETVKEPAPPIEHSVLTYQEILLEVAAAHSVSVNDILGPHRWLPIMQARHEAIYRIATTLTEMPFDQIARLFGRDPHAIRHSLQVHASRHGLPVLARPTGRPSKSHPVSQEAEAA